jgi:outer membrane protein assembly factor BamD (BamD/ComL family)
VRSASFTSVWLDRLDSRRVPSPSMNMHRTFFLLMVVAGVAHGQMGGTGFDRSPMGGAGDPEVSYSPSDTISRDRKQSRWWSRSKHDSAVRQFTYAQQLEEREEWKAAVKAYDVVVHKWHETAEAVLAQAALADVLVKMGKLDDAFSEYQYLFDHYPGAFDLDWAVAQQLAVAKAVLATHSDEGGLNALFNSPEVALPMFERIVQNAPRWAETPTVRFARGKLLEQLERYPEAVKAYETLEQRHPRSDEAAVAAYRKTVCLRTMADKSTRDEKLCRRALSVCEQYLARYRGAEHEETVRAQAALLRERLALMAYTRAQYYDSKARRPDAAQVAYESFLRDFPFSAKADAARARLAELTELSEGPEFGPKTQSESGVE